MLHGAPREVPTTPFAPAHGIALAAALVVATWSTDGRAYCRTTTCQPQIDCVYDNNNCATVGLPLYWPTQCVSFTVHKNGSVLREIDSGVVRKLANKAFKRWLSADCSGDPVSLQIADFGLASCGEPEYNQTAPNANVILFRDTEWPYPGIFSTLAFTEVTFNTETGEIYDADIEINSAAQRFTTGDEEIGIDLSAVLTHEIGHFLGLDHSLVDGATMSPIYATGDTSTRSLHPDDIAGICEIYPAGREMTGDDCIPRHGFSRLCEAEATKGCGLGRRGPGSASAWLALLGFALARPLSRRRRNKNRPQS